MKQAKEACIILKDVKRSFGDKEVIKGISLQVEPKEIFGLLGPSGSGKTTLVKMIAGIDEASSGSVTLLGTRMPKLSMMTRIGYMAQSDALYTELSAKENLAFFAALFGLKGDIRKERMSYVMDLVGLSEHMKKPVSAFSGGMKRRLSLAIALMHKPEVLILDEQTVGIDPVLRQSIWQELDGLSKEGTAIIITTHVMDEADKCNSLGMIRDGELIASGSPEELKKDTGTNSIEGAFLYYGGVRT